MLVGGEPGIGKSRLTRVLRERFSTEPYTVLRYQCRPITSTLPSIPSSSNSNGQRASLARIRPSRSSTRWKPCSPAASQLAESAPLFAALAFATPERYPPFNLSPQKQKEKTLEALARQVEALAQRQPLLMISEDVHWIDATSQEALDLLVPRSAGATRLANRHLPAGVRPTLDRTGARHLWAESPRTATRRRAGDQGDRGKPLPPEVLEQIVAHTDGVPLFVEELTKSVLESKLLRDAGDRYVLDGPVARARHPDHTARLTDRPPGPPRTDPRDRPDRRVYRARVFV